MIQFGAGAYTLSGQMGQLPSMYDHYLRHAELHDDCGIGEAEGKPAFVTVRRNGEGWPFLAVSLRHGDLIPSVGALLVPETDLLLIGCDNTILAYDLKGPARLWRGDVFGGFWHWCRHNDIVLMSGELDFVAYSLTGERLWEAYVEPPWYYTISGDRLELDVMGRKSTLFLRTGRPA